jgi:hypothetical protein
VVDFRGGQIYHRLLGLESFVNSDASIVAETFSWLVSNDDVDLRVENEMNVHSTGVGVVQLDDGIV